jgi:hypothetical protein
MGSCSNGSSLRTRCVEPASSVLSLFNGRGSLRWPFSFERSGKCGSGNAGSGNAHNNVQPIVIVNYILRVL